LEDKLEDKKEEKEEPKKKSNKLLIILLSVLAVLVLVGLAAWVLWRSLGGKISSKFLSLFLSKTAGENVKVENDGKKISFDGKGGQFSYSAEGKLPDGFPSDFPIYPGAKLTSSWTTTGEDSKGISVVWETTDSVTQVKLFYKDKLTAGGWKIDNELAQETMQTISFEKDKTSGFVGLAESNGKLTISVTLGIK